MSEGEKYGRLTFLEDLGLDEENHTVGRFLCDCGVVATKRLARVGGETRSCGCLWWEVRRRR